MFFSLPSFTLTFLPPSLAKPGTAADAGGGRLNVYDAIRSSVVHAATFRARKGYRSGIIWTASSGHI